MKWFRLLSEPVKIAMITGIFAIIAAVIGSITLGIFTLVSRTPDHAASTPVVNTQTHFSSPTASQQTPSPTSTPSPTPAINPYASHSGQLVLDDPLANDSMGYSWDNGVATSYGNCNFEQDHTYHVFAVPNYYHRCAAEKTDFSNLTFEVTLKILKGYCGGMIFRADAQSLSYYYFVICQDGTYDFAIYNDGNEKLIQKAASNSNIHTGLGQTNTIAVVAINDSINLYINDSSQAVYTTSQTTFNQGQIGLLAESDGNDPTDVAFTNARVWS